MRLSHLYKDKGAVDPVNNTDSSVTQSRMADEQRIVSSILLSCLSLPGRLASLAELIIWWVNTYESLSNDRDLKEEDISGEDCP